MVPDYISEKKMKELKVDANGNGQCFPCMGCRSFLSPWFDKDGKAKFYGRFNQGVCTLNLPYLALLAYEHAANNTGLRDRKYWGDARTEKDDPHSTRVKFHFSADYK